MQASESALRLISVLEAVGALAWKRTPPQRRRHLADTPTPDVTGGRSGNDTALKVCLQELPHGLG